MCACATAKRRRKQARMIRGRKIKNLDFKTAANSKKRAA